MNHFQNSLGITICDDFSAPKFSGVTHQIAFRDLMGNAISLGSASIIKGVYCFINEAYVSDVFQKVVLNHVAEVCLWPSNHFKELQDFLERIEGNVFQFKQQPSAQLVAVMAEKNKAWEYEIMD